MDERTGSTSLKYISLLPFILLSFLGAVFIYFASIRSEVKQLSGCFVAKMNMVSICPKDKSYVKINNISEHLKNAILLSEDASFFGHRGFDWYELKASFNQNLRAGKFARGGSTITQQLAKNIFLSPDKSIFRKIEEAFYTIHIENNFKKNQIFELYLNAIELGENLFGVKPASKFYFNKSPSEINILEAAFMAFLLPSPKHYSQSFRRQKLTSFAKQRILDILYRMLRFRRISEAQYLAAKDLVDLFPWRELGPESRMLLGEPGVQFDLPIPETDFESIGDQYNDELTE